jgi:hypothetical protein
MSDNKFFAFSFVGRAVRTDQLSQYLGIKSGTSTIEELRKPYNQGTLTEGEGPIQMTSSIRKHVLYKRKKLFTVLKKVDEH